MKKVVLAGGRDGGHVAEARVCLSATTKLIIGSQCLEDADGDGGRVL